MSVIMRAEIVALLVIGLGNVVALGYGLLWIIGIDPWSRIVVGLASLAAIGIGFTGLLITYTWKPIPPRDWTIAAKAALTPRTRG